MRCLLDPDVISELATARNTRLASAVGRHELAEGLILVTGKKRESSRVPGLKVENWLR